MRRPDALVMTRAARLLALVLLLIGSCCASGCASLHPTLNVSEQAGLGQAQRLEIEELVSGPELRYVHRLTVSDPAVLRELSTALDADLALGPLVDCLARYRLSFVLATGEVQALDYYCDGGTSFLRGAQSFWSGQQAQPPAEFDAVLSNLLPEPPR
jgi:hypothetical protein